MEHASWLQSLEGIIINIIKLKIYFWNHKTFQELYSRFAWLISNIHHNFILDLWQPRLISFLLFMWKLLLFSKSRSTQPVLRLSSQWSQYWCGIGRGQCSTLGHIALERCALLFVCIVFTFDPLHGATKCIFFPYLIAIAFVCDTWKALAAIIRKVGSSRIEADAEGKCRVNFLYFKHRIFWLKILKYYF